MLRLSQVRLAASATAAVAVGYCIFCCISHYLANSRSLIAFSSGSSSPIYTPTALDGFLKRRPPIKPTLAHHSPLPDPLGKDMCILDVDTRTLAGPNEPWSPHSFNWDESSLESAGILNHYLYAKLHSYRYLFIRSPQYPDRTTAWSRIPALEYVFANTTCRWAIYLDSDAILPHLRLPAERLLAYWNLTASPDTVLAASEEPRDWLRTHWKLTLPELEVLYAEPTRSWVQGLDSRGRRGLNAGVMVVQRTRETAEFLRRWGDCPSLHKGCERLLDAWPAEQGALNEYVRYDFPEDRVKGLKCDEAHGNPGATIGCRGTLVRHYTLAKKDVKDAVEGMASREVLEEAQREMLKEKKEIYVELGQL
ncbi:hypothetical protein GE09DRAFT_1117658 [Coniochaeta sp. 2T2.1]|nr:hypothetical protein GE09DRAFT_1117658 [Coniochaeta sp. 2T2.1]